MEIKIIEVDGAKIGEVTAEGVAIRTPQEALDIMAEASFQGARGLIFYEENLTPEFFDLKTRLAGEILQKFSNYRMLLAIVGDFSRYSSNSLQAFIRESNRGNQVFFVPDRAAATHRLARASG